MGGREVQALHLAAVNNRNRKQLGEPNELCYGFWIPARLGRVNTRLVCSNQPLCNLPCIVWVGRGRARNAQLVPCGKPCRPWHRQQGRLTRDGHVDGTFRLTHRYLKQATDHQTRVVLVLHAMVHFGILAKDPSLVSRLLIPLNVTVARAGHGSGKPPRPCSGGDQNWVVSPPGRMNSCAIVEQAHIDMDRRRRRLARHHAVAQGGI